MKMRANGSLYELCTDWPKLPEGWAFGYVPGVAVDSQDRIHVVHRGEHPVIVFDADGNVIRSWGDGLFGMAHGLTIAPDDSMYIVDCDHHTVRKFTPDGELLLTLGTEDQASPDGRPFNKPTDLAFGPAGEMYVSDGYGASRMHKFSAEGELLLSWGTEGEGPGQFNMPHGVHVDEAGQVFVADRENNRIQVFTPDGDFISQSTGFAQPCNLAMTQDAVYVAELGHRLSILDRDWQVLAQWDGEADQTKDLFRSPHDVCTDSHGNLYVSEVLKGSRVQKFLRR